MKLSKILGALITALALTNTHADITDGKFTTAQIWDVQYYWSGTTLNASGFNNLFASVNYATQATSAARLTDAQIADAASNGRYFAFFNSTTNPGTYGLGLYESNGTLYKVINNTGTFSALGNGAIFYLGNGSWGTVITPEAGYSKGQSGTFTGMDTSVSAADLTGYTYTNTTPLTAGQTAGSSGPTVTGTSTTNTVTSTTTNGTPVTTITSAPDTPIVSTATALNRGTQTAKTLTVNNVLTTTTYNPIITTTTVTTPTTVTTTTTPVTVTTYSDNTTTSTTGSPIVTTSTGTPIVTSSSATDNGTPTITDQIVQSWTTRIDGIDRIRQNSDWTNQALTGNVVERFIVDEKGVKQRIGAFGDEKQGWMYVIGEGNFANVKDGYKQKGNVAGIGYDRRVTPNLIVGVSYAEARRSLTGDQAGADSFKQVGTLYSLYGFNGWMLNTTLGHSNNRFTTYHGIQELNISNIGVTNGVDKWLHNRLYTPDFKNIKLLAGIRTNHTKLDAFSESGDPLTAMSYEKVDQVRTTNEYGLRWDKQIGKVVLGAEYAMTNNKLETSTLTLGFTPSSNVLGNIGVRNQKQNGIENNVGFTSITWRF